MGGLDDNWLVAEFERVERELKEWSPDLRASFEALTGQRADLRMDLKRVLRPDVAFPSGGAVGRRHSNAGGSRR